MKRLLGLLCVLGLFFSINLKAMDGTPGAASQYVNIDNSSHSTSVAEEVVETTPVSSASQQTVVEKPAPDQIQQAVANAKWYQKLGQRIKSCGSSISNGYHKICEGLSLIKGKTVNGAKFLVCTKTGRAVLVMTLVVGYAIEIELLGYDPIHAQDAYAYAVANLPAFGSAANSTL